MSLIIKSCSAIGAAAETIVVDRGIGGELYGCIYFGNGVRVSKGKFG